MTENQKFINQIYQILAINFGESTAKMYRKYYNDKDNNTILISAKELLADLVGPENAAKQLQNLDELN